MTESEVPLDDVIKCELSRARERANQGSPIFVVHLINAKDSAKKAGIDISAQIAEIEKTGYTANTCVNLALAKERAEAKDYCFGILLRSANTYAREAGIDISKEVREIIALYHDGRQAKKQA